MSLTQRELLKREFVNLSALKNHWADRFVAEMEFAEGLVKLHPNKAKAWNKLIVQAAAMVCAAAASGKADRLEKAVKEAEGVLAPIGKAAKTYTCHCVAHAHIDMNWLWSWPETVAVTNDTFTTVLKLMDDYPDLCFSQSQASVYEIIRQYNPALLEPMRKRIAEGRWEVNAVHWVEGDKNIASGESLARHMLYTRRYFKEHFGLTPEQAPLDWECDMFGHCRTLPGIITRGGASRYYMCRCGTPERPPVFWWQGPDGSKVIVYHDKSGYNGQIGPYLMPHMLGFLEKTGIRDYMWVYGMGDHGGGPTRRDIARCHDLDSWPVYPNFRLATTRKFYEVLEANAVKWPVIDEEINFEFTGCYTTQTMIKKGNRYGENYCLEAELAAAMAQRVVGREYPAQQIREAWIDVLFGQFHDILPGSGVHWTREYQVGLFQKIAAATNMIKTHSWRALAGAVDTSFAGVAGVSPARGRDGRDTVLPENTSTTFGAGVGRGTMVGGLSCASHAGDGPRPFVVFNPVEARRNEVVTATVWDNDTGIAPGDLKTKNFVIRTPDGKVIPAQKLGSGHYWGHNFVDLAVPVSVEPLSYASFAIEEGNAEPPANAVKFSEVPARHEPHAPTNPALENEFLAVEFDSLTGGVAKLVDKSTGQDLADAANPLGVLELVQERGRGMSAWIIGQIQSRQYPLEVKSLEREASGPYVCSLVAKLKVGSSDVTVTYSLKAGQRWLEIQVDATWVERGTRETGTPNLRMRFPVAVEDPRGQYEVPFGAVVRSLNHGEEVPALRWADVSGQANGSSARAGLALLNDCKYGHSLEDNILRLTLIRSSHDPDPLPEIGEHNIRMAVVPHGSTLATDELIRLGAAFNHPLAVISTDVHKGQLPAVGSAVAAVEPASVVLSSIRKAQDEDALIVHLYETAGNAVEAQVTLDGKLLGRAGEAVEVDLLERPRDTSTARVTKSGFSVALPAYGIAAVKVSLEK